MDRLASMTAFVKTVESGSFAATASALGISPQMVAKHVAYLEARLGTRLLNRTTRKQSVTEIGKAYYDRCKVALKEVDWADALSDEAKGKPRGRLRINAPVTFGAHTLTPLVTKYLHRHPEVEVDMVLNDRFVDPIADAFEAVFRIGSLDGTSLQTLELLPFQLIACASPTYLRERGTPSTPADLSNHQCIAFTNWPAPTISDWRFVRDGRSLQVAISSRLKVNNASALLQAALAGFGLAIIARDLARTHLSAGHLVQVLPEYQTPSRPMHLLFPPTRRQSPKLKSFINAVMEQLSPPTSARSGLPLQIESRPIRMGGAKSDG